MKKHWLLGTLLGAIALPSFAVDGYKDIKFGTDESPNDFYQNH